MNSSAASNEGSDSVEPWDEEPSPEQASEPGTHPEGDPALAAQAPPAEFLLEPTGSRQRLDRHLAARFPQISRATIRRCIESGDLRVNGNVVKPTYTPQSGDEVTWNWPKPTPLALGPETWPLDVLYEDSSLLVLNKPAERVVHPGAGHVTGTVVHALLHHCRGQLSGIGGVERPGIVHRLDLGTSGCLIVAKTDFSHQALANQFLLRTVSKNYLALVCGSVVPTQGEIRTGIARDPHHRKRMAVVQNGRPAWTSYRLMKPLRACSLVETILHTGRTHQIRVHLAHLGFPLVGDEVYGARANQRFRQQTGFTPPRLMLHARQIAFDHPHTGKRLQIVAPTPPDFTRTLEALAPNPSL